MDYALGKFYEQIKFNWNSKVTMFELFPRSFQFYLPQSFGTILSMLFCIRSTICATFINHFLRVDWIKFFWFENLFSFILCKAFKTSFGGYLLLA